MTTITSLQLRTDYENIVKQAMSGQSFSVTYRGKPAFNINSDLQNADDTSKPAPKSGRAFLEYLKNREPVDYSDSPVFHMTAQETKEYIRSEKAKKYGYE
jgi:antitoxin (DNA-binding transcriptional repressor) of toxin-antitoxin stability system